MNKMNQTEIRKWAIGGLSAVILWGGAGFAGIHTAFAAESAAVVAAAIQQEGAADLVNARIKGIVEDAAYASWKDSKELQASLADGSTLLEATGLSETELMARLAYPLFKEIADAQASGKLSADQAETMKADAARKLHTAIGTAGFQAKTPDSIVKALAHSIVADTSNVSGVDLATVQDDLLSGQSLADASGLGAAALSSLLQQLAGSRIDKALVSAELSADEAAQAKTQAAAFIAEAVNKGGYEAPRDLKDAGDIVQDKLDSILFDTAILADVETGSIKDALLGGSTLADASGLGASQLLSDLTAAVKSDLQTAYSRKEITEEAMNQALAAASKQLQEMITRPGLLKEGEGSGYETLLRNSLKDVIANTASFTDDKTQYDVRMELVNGASLADAAGLTVQDLADRLTAIAAQEADKAVSNLKLTVQEADKAKQELARQFADIAGAKGYVNDREKADYSYLIYDQLNSLAWNAAILADLTGSEVQAAVEEGASYSQATGLSGDEILASILGQTERQIDRLQSSGLIPADTAASLKEAALVKLKAAIL
ncbi:hypothetical protein [Gorillibacterium sp. sgz5001074]|uniref:hypothetical protein n=1 Tax=Gorillibacterium sp. sgz5001074 TaxID=3446695 RepID=UPI003F6645FB